MKHLCILLFYTALTLVTFELQAQKAKPVSPPTYTARFFSDLSINRVERAFERLYATNPVFKEKEAAAIAAQRVELERLMREQLGKYIGYNFMGGKSIGGGYMVARSYLVRFENEPLRFVFVFYKPNTEWMLYNFSFDTGFVEELEESIRVYFLPPLE